MTAPAFTMESVSAMVGKPKLLPKYVILDVEGIPTPVLFSPHLEHSRMVPLVRVGSKPTLAPVFTVISAGFYQVQHRVEFDRERELPSFTSKLEVSVSGHSESLGVSHRPEDAEIIRTHLLGGGK